MPDPVVSFSDELTRRVGYDVPFLSSETIAKLNALDPSILADRLSQSGVPVNSAGTSPGKLAQRVFDEATRRAQLESQESADSATSFLSRAIGEITGEFLAQILLPLV